MAITPQPQPCGESYLVTACGACVMCARRKAAKARRRAMAERNRAHAATLNWWDAKKG